LGGAQGFSIGQTESESKVLEAIRKFLLELPGSYKTNRKISNVVGIYKDIGRKAAKPYGPFSLTVRNPDFFINVLIPFFDALLWHSKKELDYIDWRTVLRIKEEGKHFTPEGEKIVKLLVKRGGNGANEVSSFLWNG
jgi:hypothetical protein